MQRLSSVEEIFQSLIENWCILLLNIRADIGTISSDSVFRILIDDEREIDNHRRATSEAMNRGEIYRTKEKIAERSARPGFCVIVSRDFIARILTLTQ